MFCVKKVKIMLFSLHSSKRPWTQSLFLEVTEAVEVLGWASPLLTYVPSYFYFYFLTSSLDTDRFYKDSIFFIFPFSLGTPWPLVFISITNSKHQVFGYPVIKCMWYAHRLRWWKYFYCQLTYRVVFIRRLQQLNWQNVQCNSSDWWCNFKKFTCCRHGSSNMLNYRFL